MSENNFMFLLSDNRVTDKMKKLTQYFTYKEVMKEFKWNLLWDLFDGDKENMNISHECLDRHVDKGTAVRLKFADGHMERYTFKELSHWTSRFANYLEKQGVEPGDRVCVMLEPSLAYYTCVFGAVKRGAIAVPLFTLFGPEALAQRIKDCDPKILALHPEKASLGAAFHRLKLLISGPELFQEIEKESKSYKPKTKTNDLAIFQYTSGTTREVPTSPPRAASSAARTRAPPTPRRRTRAAPPSDAACAPTPPRPRIPDDGKAWTGIWRSGAKGRLMKIQNAITSEPSRVWGLANANVRMGGTCLALLLFLQETKNS